MPALMFAIGLDPYCIAGTRRTPCHRAARCEAPQTGAAAARWRVLLGLGRQFLRLGNPAFDAAGKSDLFADIVRGGRGEIGDLLIVEDAKIVEFLLDGRRNAGKLLEVVGDAA